MTKTMDPAMMQRAQQMMSNPAMAQQAMNQMESMSEDDLKSHLNQLPAAAAASAPAAPVTVLAPKQASLPPSLEEPQEPKEEPSSSGAKSGPPSPSKVDAKTKLRQNIKASEEGEKTTVAALQETTLKLEATQKLEAGCSTVEEAEEAEEEEAAPQTPEVRQATDLTLTRLSNPNPNLTPNPTLTPSNHSSYQPQP
mgnify:CR=1 FL=1